MRSNPFVWLVGLFAVTFACAQQAALTPTQQLARDIYKQLIEINTTDTPLGNVTTAAEAMAARFRATGFPAEEVHVLGPLPNKHNRESRLSAMSARRSCAVCGPFGFHLRAG